MQPFRLLHTENSSTLMPFRLKRILLCILALLYIHTYFIGSSLRGFSESILHYKIINQVHMNPLLTCSQREWLHSSVGGASHRYREVTDSNPVEVLHFFQASLRNCKNCVHCDDHFFIFKTDFHEILSPYCSLRNR